MYAVVGESGMTGGGLYQTRLALEASSGEIDTGCGEAPPVPKAAGASMPSSGNAS